VAVSLDIDPEMARPFSDTAPRLVSLIDTKHLTTEAFGFTNVPLALWVDEGGTVVRGPESASVERSALKDMEIDDSWPDRLKFQLAVAQAIPSDPRTYRNAVIDWARNGPDSPFALSEAEVLSRMSGRDPSEAEAVAAFELGQYLYHQAGGGTEGVRAARNWWQRAHDLDPDNWTYKRQAWTLVTSVAGKAPDLLQGPNDVFTGNWLDDVVAGGGGETYVIDPRLEPQ
jgi:hypothetical protein